MEDTLQKPQSRQAKWRAAHPEKARAAQAKWRAANPEKVLAGGRASSAKWRAANQEKDRAAQASYRAENAEKIRERGASYRAANLEKVRAANRAHQVKRYAANPKVAEQGRISRARRCGASICLVTQKDLDSLLRRYRSCCAYCGRQLSKVRREWHLDHAIPLTRGGRHAIGNLVPSCVRCNHRKRSLLPVEWRYQSEEAS